MRLLVTGSQVPDLPAFKRLLLVAEEVAFMDRPSVTFQDWGTIGRASDIRRFKVDDLPVSITAHEPPSGPAEGLYQPYISADIGNPRFLQEVFDGLHDDSFAWRFIQPKAQQGKERTLGTELRADLLTDPSLPTLNLADQAVGPMFTGKVGTAEHRRALFKAIAVEASIAITSTLAVTAETALQPVTEDPRLARLLAMRTTDNSYLRESPPASGPLAIAVASTAKASWRGCTKNSGPSSAWRSASIGSKISGSTRDLRISTPSGQKLVAVTDRLAGFEAELLNVHVDFPLFQRLALPTTAGRTRIPGIKIQDTRMLRLMEVLLHGGLQLAGWRTAQIHTAILQAFGLTTDTYSLTQLRYDLRKMKAHGLLQREGRSYCYRLTEQGTKVAAMFVLFHKRVCGPLVRDFPLHKELGELTALGSSRQPKGIARVSENSGQLLRDRDSVLFSVTTATRITRWDQGDIVVLSAPLVRPNVGS